MHPGRVHLRVSNLARSLAFYRDTIGFEVLHRSEDSADLGCRSATAGASGGDAMDPAEALLRVTEVPGVRPIPPRSLLGIYHFALLLPTRAGLGDFLARQTALGTRHGAADHRFSEALYLEDPDGITIEVYVDRPRSEWTDPKGNLPLVSAPLDYAGLLDAAEGGSEGGVPPGSTIGHVHFYVDDLTRAERFYCAGLGFEKTIVIPTALFVSDGGYHHHVGLNTWVAESPVATGEDAGLVDWELVLPDQAAIRKVVARMDAEGISAGEMKGEEILFRDPWGVAVRLTAEEKGSDR